MTLIEINKTAMLAGIIGFSSEMVFLFFPFHSDTSLDLIIPVICFAIAGTIIGLLLQKHLNVNRKRLICGGAIGGGLLGLFLPAGTLGYIAAIFLFSIVIAVSIREWKTGLRVLAGGIIGSILGVIILAFMTYILPPDFFMSKYYSLSASVDVGILFYFLVFGMLIIEHIKIVK